MSLPKVYTVSLSDEQILITCEVLRAVQWPGKALEKGCELVQTFEGIAARILKDREPENAPVSK